MTDEYSNSFMSAFCYSKNDFETNIAIITLSTKEYLDLYIKLSRITL